MMSFERAYAQFLEKHLDEARGMRRERLFKGLGYGEKLFAKNAWWPAIGSFDHLYPEFMVRDVKRGYRLIDFVYLRPPHRIAFEADGYHPHQLDRYAFDDDRERQNMLVLDGWKVFRYTIDQLKDRPKEVQRQLQQIMGTFYGKQGMEQALLTPKELSLLQFAGSRGDAFTPQEAAEWLGLTVRQTLAYLHRLVDKGHLIPASGEKRIRSYMISYPDADLESM